MQSSKKSHFHKYNLFFTKKNTKVIKGITNNFIKIRRIQKSNKIFMFEKKILNECFFFILIRDHISHFSKAHFNYI